MKNHFTFFSNKDKQAIENKIGEIEQKTSGEIVVMAVSSSDTYSFFILFFSTIFAAVFSALILNISAYILPESFLKQIMISPFTLREEFIVRLNTGIIPLIILTIISTVIFYNLFQSIKTLIRGFIPNLTLSNQVKERAFKEFYSRGLYKTRDLTGILILFSDFEKMVYILADKGIYKKITDKTLNEYAQKITKHIKKNKDSLGLIEVLEELGKILETNFPIKADDTNELSNRVIEIK